MADLRSHTASGASWRLTSEKINSLQVEAIDALIKRAKAAHFVNVYVRINGKDETYEADWLKHLQRLPGREFSATERLHNLCDAIAEQADESPFTREEWERVDKQTAEHTSEIARLRRALKEILGWREIDRNSLGERVREIERIATEALTDEERVGG